MWVRLCPLAHPCPHSAVPFLKDCLFCGSGLSPWLLDKYLNFSGDQFQPSGKKGNRGANMKNHLALCTDQRHHAPGPYSRGVGWTWVTPRSCNWKSSVIVRLGAWEFWVLCHQILPTEAMLEIQRSNSFISRPLWDKRNHGLLHQCSSTRQGGIRMSC